MAVAKRPAPKSNNAIEMLSADHKMVKDLFKQFAALKKHEGETDEIAALVRKICQALTIHASIEEEIFYPAVRAAIDDGDLMDEALVEHAGAKALVAQLEEMDPGDELFDAKVTVLGEQIAHHVKEEEAEMFPKARKAKVDIAQLGAQMSKRKSALMTDMGMDLAEGSRAEQSSARPKRGTELRR
jgi:hemerythrin superfamily protein